MNSNYEKTLDENFDKALTLCSNDYSHSELINFLKSGSIPEKQYAALMLDSLNSDKDAEIFLSNMINCDGKIREAAAQKFLEFVTVQQYREYFSNYPKTLAKATIDINANISRMIIEGLSLMADNNEFGYKYAEILSEYIDEAFNGLDKIVFRDKKYTINKQLFKLYWSLEGLLNYSKYLSEERLKQILSRTLEESEYTVREKAAQIIIKQTSPIFDKLKQEILSDNNYYVTRITKTLHP